MNIPKELKGYTINFNESFKNYVDFEINKQGFNEWFESQLSWINCSRTFQGQRAIWTTSFIYRSNVTNMLYAIANWVEEDKQKDYLDTLIVCHNNNLEYEKENPIEIVKPVKEKRERKPKEPKIKQHNLFNNFSIKIKI